MTADPIPNDDHDLVADLPETVGAAQIDHWLLGTVARRNALPAAVRARLTGPEPRKLRRHRSGGLT